MFAGRIENSEYIISNHITRKLHEMPFVNDVEEEWTNIERIVTEALGKRRKCRKIKENFDIGLNIWTTGMKEIIK